MNTLRLKEYREKQNLSQRDVANLIDTPQSNYWKWETGKSFPNAKQILQLCEIFECTPNDLFGFKGDYFVIMSEVKGID